MNTKKTLLPLLATAALLTLGSGGYMAMAQDTGADATVMEAGEDREYGRRDRSERGERRERHAMGRKGHHHGHRGGRRGGRGMMMNLFEQADANGDRELTRAEIDGFRASLVGNADANGDGTLSIDEFDTAFRQLTRTRMVRAFQRLDRDGDGIIGAAEMDRPLERMIERMDRDGDGILKMQDRRGGKRG